MPGNGPAKLRAFALRGLAVAAVVLTYTVGSIGTQVAALVGVSSLVLGRRRVVFVRRRRPTRRVFVRRRRRW